MNHLKLRLYPDPILLRSTVPVKTVKDNHVKTAIKMQELLKTLGGLGLAAPQVGVPYSVIVINTLGYVDGVKKILFNPEIETLSTDIYEFREGCLSFPNEFINSKRPNEVGVKYINSQGIMSFDTFSGITAVCIQHEIDHLHGKLFKD